MIWIWCIAKTIALAPQRRPSSKQAVAIVSNATPPPPSSVGMKADSAPSVRSASIASVGKRASRSTEIGIWRRELVRQRIDARMVTLEKRLVASPLTRLMTARVSRPKLDRAPCSIAEMLSNTLRLSMRSGNSMSKWSSSASITFTLAWEVMPAW